MQIFWLIALVATGIFLVQFVLTIFFGGVDVDVDVDGDANVDTDMSSMVSFKGLVHFGIGFGWTMVLSGEPTTSAVVTAVIVGIVFVVVLWRLYILAFRLQSEHKAEKPQAIVGREGRIYNNRGEGKYTLMASVNGALREVDVESESRRTDYSVGEHVQITKYQTGKFFII